MASLSGNSAGSTQIQNSGMVDQRKRKRMQSNRESARRSRMRKQKHLDDLTAQISQLKKDNSQLLTTVNLTTQQSDQVEADNAVLRAQMGELTQRLDSLNQIIGFMDRNCTSGMVDFDHLDLFNSPWNLMYLNQQPIMASAVDMFQY